MTRYTCPVCGFDGLDEDPSECSYEICSCCGFQFGVSDDDRGFTYESWRKQWIEGGMLWKHLCNPPPPGWDPVAQLRRLEGR